MSDMKNLPILPDGWAWVPFEEIGANHKNAIVDGPFGSNLKLSDYINNDDGIPVLTTKNLERGHEKDNLRYISFEKFHELRRSEVRGGDILIAKIGSCGKHGIYPDHLDSAIIPANLMKITVRESINRVLVSYYLDTLYFKKQLSSITTATAQPAFGISNFKKLLFPLPPLDEQQRIVAKIEELFTQIDAGFAALEQARVRLKRYRQAVLHASVTGKLTKDWRRNTKFHDLSFLNNQVETDNLPSIPEAWCWVLSNDIFNFVTSGSRGWAQYYSNTGPLFIRMGNLDHNTIQLDLSEVQRVQPPAGSEGQRTRLQPHDILVSITADVGMVGLVPEPFDEAYINQHIALARPKPIVHPHFIAWFLASPEAKRQFKKLQRGATKVGLGLDDIRSIFIPLPPFNEQIEIVRNIEMYYSVADETEKAINQSLHRASRLRQAILQRAFSGKLV